MSSQWPTPKTPTEARKKWGNNATVSLDVEQISKQLGVLVSLHYSIDQETAISRYWGDPMPPKTLKAVRFSGNPEALLTAFRALHMEYAKKAFKAKKKQKMGCKIILDQED